MADIEAYREAVCGVAFGDLAPDTPDQAAIGLACCFLSAVRAQIIDARPGSEPSPAELLGVAVLIIAERVDMSDAG